MAKPKKEYSYQINLIPEAEGGYTVVVPLLPGCLSYGSTIEEATGNAREAIELHLENLAAHHEPIPLVS
ncbi:MAG: type II toxin-antitoxin system HicB family antitoxin [Terriglobia bacterium]|jgi:predicted RNase H-like HicB family nuclease